VKRPIVIVCQGRSGGTILAHTLGSLPGASLLLEPFHPGLIAHVEAQVKRTPEHLRHENVEDPWRGYAAFALRDLREHYAPIGQARDRQSKYLRWLAAGCGGVPVFKLCRWWGALGYLRLTLPNPLIVHLWRDFESQWRSYSGLGFSRDYFGEWQYGYRSRFPNWGELPAKAFYRRVWEQCREAGWRMAERSLSLDELRSDPREVVGELAELGGWTRREGELLGSRMIISA
jgi:hypothetical protein